MPRKSDKMTIKDESLDKRFKLNQQQKEDIKIEYASGLISQRDLAEKYNVSRRTIQFILDPDKLKRNQEQFRERQKEGRYYDKEKHRNYMKQHREHKKELYKNNLLSEQKGANNNESI